MADFLAEGFVVQDDCGFTFLPGVVVLEGSIICLDGVTPDVRKEIEILGGSGMNAWVQTRSFRYHAWVRGSHNILRYESAHERHRERAHKHVYDTFGYGGETDVIELSTEDEIPTLGDVLSELRGWHLMNARRLRDLP